MPETRGVNEGEREEIGQKIGEIWKQNVTEIKGNKYFWKDAQKYWLL